MTTSSPTPPNGPESIETLTRALNDGTTTARELVDQALARIADPAGEGSRAFLSVADEQARATADGIDAIRAAGGALPPFAGLPFAVKDLCDIEGQVSTAGSTVLSNLPPAESNAPALQRLINAGFIMIGRTNMTEFAYSGLGLNAHYPAPASPWERGDRATTDRIPGGSSSGTGVAVADHMAVAGLGTDTGGSCRIPAAFNGVVGYKPTARRVPLDGIVPLSTSLDSVGPLARTVACCSVVDDLFSGGDGSRVPEPRPLHTVRLAALTDVVLDDLDPVVAATYSEALSHLSQLGCQMVEVGVPELLDLGELNGKGGIAAAEAYHWHQQLMAEQGDDYDQRVRTRIEPGGTITASEYIELLACRRRLINVAEERLTGFDAFVMPTVAVVPPTIASFENNDPDYYGTTNRLCLRNTAVGNFLDSCSISLPAMLPGEAPVGLMLMGRPMDDAALFSVAAGVEAALVAR